MGNLTVRLFLAMALLAVLAVSAVTWLQRDAAREGFLELEDRVTLDEAQESADALREVLEAGWQPELAFAASAPELQRFAALSPRHQGAAIFDLEGRLLAGAGLPPGTMEARVEAGRLHVAWRGLPGAGEGHELVLWGGVPLRDPAGEVVALLLTIPALPTALLEDRRDARQGEIQGRLDRRTLGAFALVIAAALLLSALLARHIVAPVHILAAAARALGRGERQRRVPALPGREMALLGEAFNDMATSLERSERLRQQLVTDVAHELRTPLAALQGQLEAVQDGLLPADAGTLGSLHEDVLHLGALVEDLQDLALAEAGQHRLEPVRVDLAEEVRGACRALGLDPRQDGPRLSLHLEEGLRLPADPRRLRQILHNLLDNARAHAPDGTLTVTAGRGAGGTTAVLTVEDDGPGIAPEHLPHLFERFYRADPARAQDGKIRTGRGGRSTGLGLAIARELVRLHGGSLRARSRETAGATGAVFEVVLPLQASS